MVLIVRSTGFQYVEKRHMKATQKKTMVKDHGNDNANQIHQDTISTITKQYGPL